MPSYFERGDAAKLERYPCYIHGFQMSTLSKKGFPNFPIRTLRCECLVEEAFLPGSKGLRPREIETYTWFKIRIGIIRWTLLADEKLIWVFWKAF